MCKPHEVTAKKEFYSIQNKWNKWKLFHGISWKWKQYTDRGHNALSAFTDCSWTCTVASGIKEYCMQWQKTVLMMFYTLRDDVLRGEWNNEC